MKTLAHWPHCTLEVSDHHFGVVRAGEQVASAGREPDGAHVAAVRPVHLHDPPSSDVVQHAGAVLLASGQQATARVHRHRGHGAACRAGGEEGAH